MEQAEQPAERVVAGKAVWEFKKGSLATAIRPVGSVLSACEDGAQDDHQQATEVVQRGIADSRVFQPPYRQVSKPSISQSLIRPGWVESIRARPKAGVKQRRSACSLAR